MKVHQALAATLSEHGVNTVFGLTGEGNLFPVDSFVRHHGGRYIAATNEAAGLMMAAGYASAAGKVGVATTTYGPGLCNTFGALVEASRERLPIVLLTGDTALARRGHSQSIDHASVVAPTGAGYETARTPERAAEGLALAFRRARLERRPVVFNVPVDWQFQEVDAATSPAAWAGITDGQSARPDPASMDVAVGLMASMRAPILVAGWGATAPGVREALLQLADTLGAPVATTLPAKGLFAGSPYDLGVFGSFATPRAAEAIQASDCVIAVGAGLNEYTGGGPGWPFFKGKRVVHCDANPSALGAEYPADAPVVADACAFATGALELLREIGHQPSPFRDRTVRPDGGKGEPADGDLSPVLAALNRELPVDRSVVVDAGRFTREGITQMEVADPRAWFCSFRGFGAIGHGLPSAIGVGVARPGSPVVLIAGDGGFMLGGLTEFNTAVRYHVDLIAVVCNDGAYGAEYRKLVAGGVDGALSMFDWPDLAPVAEALGGTGLTIRDGADVDRLGPAIAARERPLLIDVKLSPHRRTNH